MIIPGKTSNQSLAQQSRLRILQGNYLLRHQLHRLITIWRIWMGHLHWLEEMLNQCLLIRFPSWRHISLEWRRPSTNCSMSASRMHHIAELMLLGISVVLRRNHFCKILSLKLLARYRTEAHIWDLDELEKATTNCYPRSQSTHLRLLESGAPSWLISKEWKTESLILIR